MGYVKDPASRYADGGGGWLKELATGLFYSTADKVSALEDLGAGSGGGGDVTSEQLAAVDTAAGAYKSVRAASATGDITSADRLGLVVATGTSITLTIVSTGFSARDWVLVRNANADTGSANQAITVAVSGSEKINDSSTTSVPIAPGDAVLIARTVTSGTPQWLTLSPIGYLPLAANQVAAVNSAGTAQEARTQKGSLTWDIPDPPRDGRYGKWRPLWPGKLDTVKYQSRGGTACTHVIKKNGTAMTGYGSPVSIGTSEGSVTCGDSFAAGDLITCHLANVAGLSADGDGTKGVDITPNFTRTGD